MFGLSVEDVTKICKATVAKELEVATKAIFSTIVESDNENNQKMNEHLAAFSRKMNEQLSKNIDSSLNDFLQRAESMQVTAVAAEKKVTELVNSTINSAGTFEAYVNKLSKVGTSFERVMALVETGEHARTESIKQMIKMTESNNTVIKDMVGRIDTVLAKMANAHVETEAMQRQILGVVKELANNLTAAITVEDVTKDEFASEPAKAKAKKTRSKK